MPAVKKTPPQEVSKDGSIDLSPNLERVRGAIQNLPTDEGEVMNEQATEGSTTTKAEGSTGPKRKVAKKKAAVKKSPAKKANGAAKAENVTTLAEVCKGIKGMDPRRARRILRNAKVKNPGRWSWPKGNVPAGVMKALKEADAE